MQKALQTARHYLWVLLRSTWDALTRRRVIRSAGFSVSKSVFLAISSERTAQLLDVRGIYKT